MTETPPISRPALATYANYSEVGHNAFEFLIDYGQVRADADGIEIHSRIVTGPVQAKIFARLLTEAVSRFEEDHGAIPDLAQSDPFAQLLAAGPDFEQRAMMARANPLPASALSTTR